MYVSTRNHRQIGYRVPKEWETLTDTMRGVTSLGAFKRHSKGEFIRGYEQFKCSVRDCYVCREGRSELA